MKSILCFGDSNTWGFDPVGTSTSPFPVRHSHDVRWTGVLAHELGGDFRVIEEGLNGRTTVHDDPISLHRNGRAHLPVCLESHKPLDLVILMLGTNDLKTMFNLPPGEIAAGALALVKIILQSEAGPDSRPPEILLACPAVAGPFTGLPELSEKFETAFEKSQRFPGYYKAVALQFGCAFINVQEIVQPSPLDGLHLEAREHLALGRAIAASVKHIL